MEPLTEIKHIELHRPASPFLLMGSCFSLLLPPGRRPPLLPSIFLSRFPQLPNMRSIGIDISLVDVCSASGTQAYQWQRPTEDITTLSSQRTQARHIPPRVMFADSRNVVAPRETELRGRPKITLAA